MLKRKLKYFILFCLISFKGFTQTNLVPNGNFETIVNCPTGNGNITDCANWMNFRNTPDYMNACAPSGISVPYAGTGFQYAHSGVGMAGIVTWYTPNSIPNYREFIGAQLTNTLQIGQKYFMSFFINWSGYLYNWRQYAANKVGLRFSTVASTSVNPAPINNFAHLKTNIIYQDTVNWLKISGSFIADSNYKYVIIGNFFNDANTDTLSYSGPIFGAMSAYYYIDDACVSTDSLYNSTWTGLKDYGNENNKNFSLYPNPVSEKLYFHSNSNFLNYKIIISDNLSKEQKQLTLKNNDCIDVSDLVAGIYLVKIYYSDIIETKKIIINKP